MNIEAIMNPPGRVRTLRRALIEKGNDEHLRHAHKTKRANGQRCSMGNVVNRNRGRFPSP